MRNALRILVERSIPDLDDYLFAARRNGRSFRQIAQDIHDDHGIELSAGAVRQWCLQIVEVQVVRRADEMTG